MADAGEKPPVVLLVDDDARIRRTVGAGLALEGFEVVPASGGRAALAAVEQIDPAVMLLDMAMPDLDGLEVLRRLRAAGQDLPVCVLSARDEVGDRVARARGRRRRLRRQAVRARGGRRPAARAAAPPARRRTTTPSRSATSSSTARATARCAAGATSSSRGASSSCWNVFMRHPGQVIAREQLHEEVWGYDFDPKTNVADVFVGYLRRKLEAGGEPRVLHTVRGVGFVLRP